MSIPPVSDEQLERWFTYHETTDETKPKYAALEAAYLLAKKLIEMQVNHVRLRESVEETDFRAVRTAAKAFAEAIVANAPPSADATAAVRCVRLASMYANKAMNNYAQRALGGQYQLRSEALLMDALFQANAAVACGGL